MPATLHNKLIKRTRTDTRLRSDAVYVSERFRKANHAKPQERAKFPSRRGLVVVLTAQTVTTRHLHGTVLRVEDLVQ
jgi:hypothetical protein